MITILGTSGFIGSAIADALKKKKSYFYAPGRNENLIGKDLGHIIYCIGLTADFRTKPFETVTAHVCKLNEILEKCTFSSLTYLSSTRVYINAVSESVSETDKLTVDPLNNDDLYTLTKLTGECLCISSGKRTKIVRLSNVIGSSELSVNFLSDIINDIRTKGSLHLRQSMSSAKDYIFIDDAVDMLIKIAEEGREKIYNVASGINTTNESMIEALKKYFTFSCTVDESAKEVIFPKVSNNLICDEFGFVHKKISEQLSLIL